MDGRTYRRHEHLSQPVFQLNSIKVFCGANVGDTGNADTDLIALKVDALN
jgi:hypothetical protein